MICESKLQEAVVVAYGRTPSCKAGKGSFAQVHPVEYGAQALLGVLGKVPQLRPEDIGDVLVGCAMPFGVQGGNVARLIVQRAGLPDTVTAQTVNRYCSSGLQTIAAAANAIRCGEEEVMVAGGVESMSLVPMLVGAEDANPWLMEYRPEVYTTMGLTAENVARQWNISRADMDALAAESHRRAAQAQAVMRTLGMDPAKVNPWDGAMALGHPLGATGAMLTCKALGYLAHTGGRYGLVTMCIGGGMGAAGILERM